MVKVNEVKAYVNGTGEATITAYSFRTSYEVIHSPTEKLVMAGWLNNPIAWDLDIAG